MIHIWCRYTYFCLASQNRGLVLGNVLLPVAIICSLTRVSGKWLALVLNSQHPLRLNTRISHSKVTNITMHSIDHLVPVILTSNFMKFHSISLKFLVFHNLLKNKSFYHLISQIRTVIALVYENVERSNSHFFFFLFR